MSIGSNWQGEDGKKFGRKAKEWFARSITRKLEELREQKVIKYGMTDSELECVAQQYTDDPMPYVCWQDADEYRGRGWSNGAWIIDWDKVTSALRCIIEGVRTDAAVGAIRTLDDWLLADMTDTLEYDVDGGSERLSKGMRRDLAEMARARRRTWPIRCVDCGETFQRRSGARGKPIRCAGCFELRQRDSRKLGDL